MRGLDQGPQRAYGPIEIISALRAVIEMHRQVGDLVIEDGIARRGLLIRHLD